MSPKHVFRRSFTDAGAPPGAFAEMEGAYDSRMHLISYSADAIEEREAASLDDIDAMLADDRVLWIDVQGLADQGLVRALGERFDLHPLALADTVNVGQRPKIEGYDGFVFAAVRMATLPEGGDIRWEQVSVYIRQGVVITFQEKPGDCLEPLRTRLRSGRRVLLSSGADYLGCMVIDAIIDGYFPVLESYGDRLEELETDVIERPKPEVLAEVYRMKRELSLFRRAVWPLRETLSSLLRDGHDLLQDKTLPYLRDAADHTFQVVDILESYRELAGSFIEVYLSSVANRTNEVMRVLTVIATIFIPLTFIAGIYGMNFDPEASAFNMPELGWKYGYAAFWAVSLVIAAGLLYLFRRQGWLGGRSKKD
jgi:magnesium transporter